MNAEGVKRLLKKIIICLEHPDFREFGFNQKKDGDEISSFEIEELEILEDQNSSIHHKIREIIRTRKAALIDKIEIASEYAQIELMIYRIYGKIRQCFVNDSITQEGFNIDARVRFSQEELTVLSDKDSDLCNAIQSILGDHLITQDAEFAALLENDEDRNDFLDWVMEMVADYSQKELSGLDKPL